MGFNDEQVAFCNCLRYPMKLSSKALVEPILGPNAFAVGGILFNKLRGANWKVPWHHDCATAVRGQKDSQPREAAERRS